MSTFNKLPKGGINYTELGPRETMWREAEEDMLEEPVLKRGYNYVDPESKKYALSGADGKYYKIPAAATDLQDLIEHKDMNFNIGNIFKACYRLGDKPGTSVKYDLEKIVFYAQRELARHAE